MKRYLWMVPAIVALTITLGACQDKDYSGTFVGYSWKDESKGLTLSDATERIETTLKLDSSAKITAAHLDFLIKQANGSWKSRLDGTAEVSIDYSVAPTPAKVETNAQAYQAGASMFSIVTNDLMAFWTAGVGKDGTVALALVEPMTRYQFESKFEPGFDFSQALSTLTLASGRAIPTLRASSGGSIKPATWQDYLEKTAFTFYKEPYLFFGRGIFNGLSLESSVGQLLERAGIKFVDGKPQAIAAVYGFSGLGGWGGNYAAIDNFLIGKKATELLSLVDWTNPRYAGAVNDKKFFGIDVKAGATKTAQSSLDGIAGASVRMSRESTSYQRALVNAGILKDEEVIKGRF